MAISIFPSTAAEFVSNNFVVDMNDTNNNAVTLQNVKQAGTYNISLESGDTSFDIYLLDSDGALVAYSNTTTIAPAGLFQIVVILGVATSDIISFAYAGNVNNANAEGDQPGAGAYLTSISPADLPSIDDTATVIGGNFGTATTIQFISGTAELEAKNITVTNGTSLVVTRPDNLDADLDPWDLRAINTGVTPPTGTNAHILAGTVTAGAVPSWVTTSPLTAAVLNQAYSETLEATDADGAVTYTVTTGSLPTGLSLNSSTGEISGTPTSGIETFTVTASDDGGNSTTREFTLPVQLATGGTVTFDGTDIIHTFESSDDFVALTEITNAAYLIVGGGGAGGAVGGNGFKGGGGGGGGGVRSSFQADPSPESLVTISAGTIAVTIGAANGDSSLGSIQTSLAGGAGGDGSDSTGGTGENGAAGGGGGALNGSGGTGSNGGNGANGGPNEFDTGEGGAGGGGGPSGTNPPNRTTGGTGTESSITGTTIRHGDGGNTGIGNGQDGDGRNGSTSGLVVVRY